jgi:hypothetical protein
VVKERIIDFSHDGVFSSGNGVTYVGPFSCGNKREEGSSREEREKTG